MLTSDVVVWASFLTFLLLSSLKVTTIGRNDGVAQMPFAFYTQYIVPAFKNKTLFIPNFKDFAGYGDYSNAS